MTVSEVIDINIQSNIPCKSGFTPMLLNASLVKPAPIRNSVRVNPLLAI